MIIDLNGKIGCMPEAAIKSGNKNVIEIRTLRSRCKALNFRGVGKNFGEMDAQFNLAGTTKCDPHMVKLSHF